MAVLAGGLALWIALDASVRGVSGLRDVGRGAAAGVGLFAVSGFGLTRLLLPDRLRRHETLWVLPVGACAAAVGLGLLGYLHVPFKGSLAVLLAAGAALAVLVLRRRGPGPRPGLELGLSVWVAVLLAAVALVPVFRSGFATVIGDGSDAHLAVGTAQFLQHDPPTAVDVSQPVDRVPLVWRSKPPIYYGLAGVSTLSGLRTYQTIATLIALLLALAALGFFVLARELLGVGALAAVAAMAIAGLDRMVLFTGMHPYYNQTWGYFTLPFALVLSWSVVRERTAGGVALLALFLLVGAFAYPLALPIPLVALALFAWRDRRARRARGEPVASLSPRRLYRGRRSLLWLVPLGLVLAVPIFGVLEKIVGGLAVVVDPGRSLRAWGGDLRAFIPEREFVALSFHNPVLVVAAIAAIVALAYWGLRGRPAQPAWGLGAVIAFGIVTALYFRQRDFGWYFHFKALAFIGPLILVCAVAGAARLRPRGLPLGAALIAGLLLSAHASARQEITVTSDQVSPELLELRAWGASLPRGSSVRLDIHAPVQLWPAYMLSPLRLCSQRPLLNTSYPHVRISRRAEYILAEQKLLRPFDSTGPPLKENDEYALYRMRPDVPGPDRCSQAMVQTVRKVEVD